jgi:hypothetical protein
VRAGSAARPRERAGCRWRLVRRERSELRHSRLALTALLFGHFAALTALLFGHFAALAALELKLSLLQPRALIQHCLIVSECGGECV